MSDDEYIYETGSEEDYQYRSDEDEDPKDDLIAIENAYYEGDDCRQDNPVKAIELFIKVIELETEKDDQVKWRFLALEHLVKLYHRLNEPQNMLKRYKELLGYVSQVTRNECTNSINSILDVVSMGTELDVISQIYKFTLGALKTGGNERLWFNTKVKLSKTYIQSGSYADADATILELHRSCQNSDGSDDRSKGTYLLEVYGLIIQLCAATKDAARMRDVYPKIMNLNAVVEDPRTMGLIREEGGKMYMSAGQWKSAYNEFYEGFRNYQEAGNKRAKDCLKYVVLANMLALSDINPFAAREAKVYQEEKEVAAMMDLRMAYESNDLRQFEKTLQCKANRILEDSFIMAYVEPLRQSIREQVVIAMVRPFKRIKLSYMASELNLSVENVEQLLVNIILDGRLCAGIDQLNGYLELDQSESSISDKKYEAILGWTEALRAVTVSLTAQI